MDEEEWLGIEDWLEDRHTMDPMHLNLKELPKSEWLPFEEWEAINVGDVLDLNYNDHTTLYAMALDRYDEYDITVLCVILNDFAVDELSYVPLTSVNKISKRGTHEFPLEDVAFLIGIPIGYLTSDPMFVPSLIPNFVEELEVPEVP